MLNLSSLSAWNLKIMQMFELRGLSKYIHKNFSKNYCIAKTS